MTSEKVLITRRGYHTIEDELKILKGVKRPEIIKEIADARMLGDLSENAEYHAAREKQGLIEARISELEGILSRADVISIHATGDTVIRFGAHITIADQSDNRELKYQVVGPDEADIANGLLSIYSPVAKVLIGKSIGDLVEVTTQRGSKSYKILSVEYIDDI